jgi:hypothetical protein
VSPWAFLLLDFEKTILDAIQLTLLKAILTAACQDAISDERPPLA